MSCSITSAVVRSVDVGARSEVAGFAFVLCLEAATTGPSDVCCDWGVSAPVDCGLLGFRCLCGLGGAAVTAEAVAVILGCSVCATDVGRSLVTGAAATSVRRPLPPRRFLLPWAKHPNKKKRRKQIRGAQRGLNLRPW
ncbi:hypothetical protein ACJJTC_000142 [Scirpophaga incertulas]